MTAMSFNGFARLSPRTASLSSMAHSPIVRLHTRSAPKSRSLWKLTTKPTPSSISTVSSAGSGRPAADSSAWSGCSPISFPAPWTLPDGSVPPTCRSSSAASTSAVAWPCFRTSRRTSKRLSRSGSPYTPAKPKAACMSSCGISTIARSSRSTITSMRWRAWKARASPSFRSTSAPES